MMAAHLSALNDGRNASLSLMHMLHNLSVTALTFVHCSSCEVKQAEVEQVGHKQLLCKLYS